MSDGKLPHKYPKDAPEDVLAWACQACGEWVHEYGNDKKTDCSIDWRKLYMNGREKVMKEPPLGSVVIDVTGSAWQRSPNGWSNSGSDGSWHYSWERVVEQELYTFDRDFIPTEEWKAVLGDPRLPLIVYIPHEELITKEED